MANLIVSLDGMGDLILRLPFIKSALNLHQNERMYIIVGSKYVKASLKAMIDLNKYDCVILDCKSNQSKIMWFYLYYYAIKLRNTINNTYLLFLPDRYLSVPFFKFLNSKKYYGIVYNKISRISKFLNYKIDNTNEAIHKTKIALDFCELIGMTGTVEQIYNEYYVNKNIEDSKINIVIAPSSSAQRWKLWPTDKYISLCTELLSKNDNIYITLIGAGSDIEIINKIKSKICSDRCQVFYNKDMKDVLKFLNKADIFISACCGMLHVASTIKSLKIIALYGPTNKKITGPLTDNVYFIESGLECAPCFDNRTGTFKCSKDIACMNDISVNTVIKKITELIGIENV